ncbi:DUF4232 domain-containing protein [Streptomyces decoyicus]|uniref:DUF4232 domain-containing protein n=1 Tax=Streptomyces decoyicus TaxID=249567 RepID=UPI0033B2A576
MSSNTTARTARRRTLRIAAAALTAVAGLTLTACSGSDAAGAKPAGRTDSGAAAAEADGQGEAGGAGSSAGAQGSDAQAAPGGKVDTKADAAAKQPGSAHANSGGAKGSSGVQRCHTSGLKAVFATGEDATPAPDADGPTTTSIVLTNKGSSTCKIGGFPGVDLKSENGQSWSLRRSSAKHTSITLAPGDSTDFTINLGLANKDEAHPWMPASVTVTPPNETTSLTLKWPWGPLVDQTGATHPATFVNPIG